MIVGFGSVILFGLDGWTVGCIVVHDRYDTSDGLGWI